jgi:hypothetical protein
VEELFLQMTSNPIIKKRSISLKHHSQVLDEIKKMTVYPQDIIFKGYSSFNVNFDYGSFPCFREIIDNFLMMAGKDYYVLDFWYNIYNYLGRVKPHKHRTSNPLYNDYPSKTGVFYFKKPKDSGNIIVEKKVIKVKENDMIVFDSNYIHESQSNKSNDVRIIFSINMMKNVAKMYNQATNKWEMKIVK